MKCYRLRAIIRGTNKVIDSMLAHRSIRSYADRTVSDGDLDSIIRAVQAASNWVNLQLVSIIVVENTDHRGRLAELCGNQVHIAETPIFLAFCTDYHKVAPACHKKEQTLGEVMQDIDTLLVEAYKVGIALGAAVMAAESLGLGTAPIGGVCKDVLEIIHELQLPEYVFPMLGLYIGYPTGGPGLEPRFPQQATFSEGIYKTDLKDKLAEYNAIYAHHLKEYPWNNRVGNWTNLVADFYQHPFYYGGVTDALNQQGFTSAKNRYSVQKSKS